MQVFCFTHAGGTATFYNQLQGYLEPEYEVNKLEYSGHGNRRKENYYTDFDELAMDMYREIQGKYNPDDEYALIGYSMGTISVVEVLRIIMKKGELPLPKHIFLAAHEPRTMSISCDYIGKDFDKYVKERMICFGGIPENLIDKECFWRMYLPIFRADFTILSKYDFDSLRLRSNIPTTIFYSEKDTSYLEMKKWKNYFTGTCDFVAYSGNHFFIYEKCKEIADVIIEKLKV